MYTMYVLWMCRNKLNKLWNVCGLDTKPILCNLDMPGTSNTDCKLPMYWNVNLHMMAYKVINVNNKVYDLKCYWKIKQSQMCFAFLWENIWNRKLRVLFCYLWWILCIHTLHTSCSNFLCVQWKLFGRHPLYIRRLPKSQIE